jgi:gluconolactonase
MDSFSPDFKTVYVTDSGSDLGEYGVNLTAPATIYAFDVINQKNWQNRRMFAYRDNGIPDGIHTDVMGNVWAGCGDGIHVWSSEGMLLGKLRVEGGVNGFAFLPGGILVANANRLRGILDAMVKGWGMI